MLRFGLKLVLAGAFLYAGFWAARTQLDEAALSGRLSACSELLGALQQQGEVNPQAACVIYKHQVAIGFPGHDEAPHFSLSGKQL